MSQLDRAQGLIGNAGIKFPVRCATTTNITLSGYQTIDGITLASGDGNLRVLVKNQNTASENGIYDAAATAWTRSADFNGTYDCAKGTLVRSTSGTLGTGLYELTTVDPVIGTSNLAFSAMSGSGGTFNNVTLTGDTNITGNVYYNNFLVVGGALEGYSLAIKEHGIRATAEAFSFDFNYHTAILQAGALALTFTNVRVGSAPFLLSSMLMYLANAGLATITWNSPNGIAWIKTDGTGDITSSTTCPTTLHNSGFDYVAIWAINTGVATTIAGKVVR